MTTTSHAPAPWGLPPAGAAISHARRSAQAVAAQPVRTTSTRSTKRHQQKKESRVYWYYSQFLNKYNTSVIPYTSTTSYCSTPPPVLVVLLYCGSGTTTVHCSTGAVLQITELAYFEVLYSYSIYKYCRVHSTDCLQFKFQFQLQ